MEKTIYEKLLELGIKENEIDTHCSDIYVLKNEISDSFVNDYPFKNIVTIFRSELDNKRYYEIPFAYEEYYNKR